MTITQAAFITSVLKSKALPWKYTHLSQELKMPLLKPKRENSGKGSKQGYFLPFFLFFKFEEQDCLHTKTGNKFSDEASEMWDQSTLEMWIQSESTPLTSLLFACVL